MLARPLVLLAMGEKWEPAVLVIQVLASVFAFQTLGSLSQPLAMATNNNRMLFHRDLQGFVMRVPIVLTGMFLAGLPGVIYARAITGSIGVALHMQVVKKIPALSFTQQLSANLRSILSVMAMAAAVLTYENYWIDWDVGTFTRLIQLGVLVGLGAGVYVVVHGAIWLAAGRPSGPEAEGLRLLAGLRRKILSSS